MSDKQQIEQLLGELVQAQATTTVASYANLVGLGLISQEEAFAGMRKTAATLGRDYIAERVAAEINSLADLAEASPFTVIHGGKQDDAVDDDRPEAA